MVTTIVISSITVLSMVASVLFCPYLKIGKTKLGLYWIICLLGGILLLLFGCLPLNEAFDGLTTNTAINPIKILILFISMSLISIFLGDAGFFDYVADKIFVFSHGGKLRLFIILYFAVAILTIFTSNDIIILTFSPAICIFCSRAKVSPVPYLFGEFVAGNTWSTMLIVGNPTNIYLAGSMGISFYQYFSVMWLPTLVGGLVGFLALLALFHKTFFSHNHKLVQYGVKSHKKVEIQKTPLIVAVCHLIVCLVFLAISDIIGIEMWLICLTLAISLTIFNIIYQLIKEKSVKKVLISIKKSPFELIPFVISMFIIVLALSKCNVTKFFGELLITNTKYDGFIFGFSSVFSANLLNNIPMSVLFEKIIAGNSLYALYGTIIGSNVGAFITPVGALAGIMWTKILNNYNVKISFAKFLLYGVCCALPILLTSTLTLYLTF